MDPATMALLASAGASLAGGFLGSQGGPKETKIQKKQRHLIDDLIASLKGGGSFSGLFNTDENAFQRSFVDPAKSIFNNQIAPQIQQQYIAGGQQRGSGLDDQLLRAGVDLDQLLNQNYLAFQNQGKDRMQSILGNILGQPSGAPSGMGTLDRLSQSAGGFLSSDSFSNMLSNYMNPKQTSNTPIDQSMAQPRKGFLPDWKVGDQRWGY